MRSPDSSLISTRVSLFVLISILPFLPQTQLLCVNMLLRFVFPGHYRHARPSPAPQRRLTPFAPRHVRDTPSILVLDFLACSDEGLTFGAVLGDVHRFLSKV